MAFIKDEPAKAASLVVNLQKLAEANKAKDLRSFVVFMGGLELKDRLEKVAAEKKLTIPMAVLPKDGQERRISRYNLHPDAKNTVLLYTRSRAHRSFVNVDDASFQAVVKSAEEMLKGQPDPPQ